MSVDFVTALHGVLEEEIGRYCSEMHTGCQAALLTTNDGGRTWRRTTLSHIFWALDFVSPLDGFGTTAHGRLYHTGDGGLSWYPVAGQPAPFAALSFPDQLHGWATSGRFLYRTANRGSSWTRLAFQCPQPAIGGRISGLSFPDTRTGFAMCQGPNGPFSLTLYRSSDGGSSWRRVSVVDQMAHITGPIDFITPQVGYVEAGFGSILRTIDGGRTFHVAVGSPQAGQMDMSWPDARSGYVSPGPFLERTRDGGAHWRQVYPALQPEGPVLFLSPRAGIGAATGWSPGTIMQTRDGGHHWRETGLLADAAVAELVRQRGRAVWAIATVTKGYPDVVALRSTDGGRSWQTMRRHLGAGASLSFASARVGVLDDNQGHLYLTHDGGASWKVLPQHRHVWDVQLASVNDMWGIAQSSLPVHSSDGGRTWSEVPISVQGFELSQVIFVDARHGWLTGTLCITPGHCDSAIIRTSDGARHWTLIRFRTAVVSQDVSFVTPRLGFAGGGAPLWRTQDGGRTWVAVHTPSPVSG